jgi:hypothetical protein
VLEMAARDYKTFGLLQQLTANQPKTAAEVREERQRLAEEQTGQLVSEVATMQRTLAALKDALGESQARRTRLRTDATPMESEQSGHWPPAQGAVISKVENYVQGAGTAIMAEVTHTSSPAQSLGQLPVIHAPALDATENQVYQAVGVLGGKVNGRGLVMVDSGACFSMVTEKVAEVHGLQMRAYSSRFVGAAPGAPPSELIGQVDLVL